MSLFVRQSFIILTTIIATTCAAIICKVELTYFCLTNKKVTYCRLKIALEGGDSSAMLSICVKGEIDNNLLFFLK